MDDPRPDEMAVWDVREDDIELDEDIELRCSECGDLLEDLADIEEGMHFLCDPTVKWQDGELDEGGESGC